MSERLRAAILTSGRVRGELVLVDTFLNHRIDVDLMAEIGAWLAGRFDPVDAVVTSEASGIAPAYAAATAMGVPVVFAKKRNEPRPETLNRQVVSRRPRATVPGSSSPRTSSTASGRRW